MVTYNFPPDPWLAPPEQRTCTRCGIVLVGEDEAGSYYQEAVQVQDSGLIFMDRVHQCPDGKPHSLPGGDGDGGAG